jgi:type IV pilus assembly protein PilY1
MRWHALVLINVFAAIILFLSASVRAEVVIPPVPLGSTAPIPHNVLLTPSVEYPTIISVANLGAYNVNQTYVGYFDSNKCYKYHFSVNADERHFYPFRRVDGHTCSGIPNTSLWSGNYLNWATTQTIDPFRKAMTGGYRVKDTRTETWLEKARHDRDHVLLNENSLFPDRRLPAAGNASDVVAGATPFGTYRDELGVKTTGFVMSKIEAQYNKVIFSIDGNGGEVIAYNPAVHGITEDFSKSKSYELYVRVKVCDSTVGLEENCVRYPSGYYKPEGLIQKYSGRLRFGIFGYLNESNWPMRDGGVLRANQKYVGPKKFAPSDASSEPWVDNENGEWDPDTGVLIVNPNPDDATATSQHTSPPVTNSGVINYLNKFGQMTSEKAKTFDPVSELYYAATRYLKKQGGVESYSSLSSDRSWAYKQADGFPVVTDWQDPYQYWCQSSAILGIGDVYTWADKNLPGNSSSTREWEPDVPAEVAADSTVDVLRASNKVFELEGLSENPGNFSGRNNSAYIAGLAYDNRTVDLRPALKGKQTVPTYWVDVRELQTVVPKSENQYWLAAKYGGFAVPEGYSPYTRTESLPESWWWTNGETLSSGDKRPDNYFVASDAGQMVNSLKNAFEQLVEGVSRSGSGLAANSTSLTAGTMVFQSSYDTGNLSGELKAFEINPVTGAPSSSPKWVASEHFPIASQWANRTNIFFNKDGRSSGYQRFTHENLSDVQKGFLSQAVVDYIRGKRDGEGTAFRRRGGLIGTIVNSQPVVVGKPIRGLYSTATFSGGGADYNTYVGARSGRTPVVYVGANDGMLHGFNASTGEETYAFIPQAALPGLAAYASTGYSHRFFVDGKLTVADVYIDNAWKTVLVGTFGAGGRGVFALDVTDPSSVRFLWEKSEADISALGNVLSKPVIAQVADGDWRVIMGNGPNSSGNSAQLLMISLRDGSVTTVDTNATNNNGLSGVYTWDANGDGYVDTVYAGDLEGHLWRFTGLASIAPVVSQLFHAKDPDGKGQPITATPLVGKHKNSHATWVWFGTGRYITNEDLTDTQTQTWYGLIDAGSEIAGRSELGGRSNIAEVRFSDELKVRVFPEAGALSAGQKGWYADLPIARERMVLQNVVDGKVLVGTSRIPDTTDPCAPAGTGYTMFINPFTGGRLTASYLDLSRDGYFTGADMVVLDGQNVVVSGIRLDSASQGSLMIGDQLVSGLENKNIFQYGKAGSRGVTRSSWRELRHP